MEKIGFGGGCHWCTEGVFQAIRGVLEVQQGFICSDAPADNWAEAVVVYFDEAQIGVATLLEIHLRTHSTTKVFEPKSKYRSAVYTFDDAQATALKHIMSSLALTFEAPMSTEILPFREFKPSDTRYQNYYATNPEKPFCKRFIDPKLDILKKNFANVVLPTQAAFNSQSEK